MDNSRKAKFLNAKTTITLVQLPIRY